MDRAEAIKKLLMQKGFGVEGASVAAEHLVANGVTMQQQIGAKERLTERAGGEVFLKEEYEAEYTLAEQIEILLERLAHYEDMEEQGRLVELPCPMGAELWMLITRSWSEGCTEFSFVRRSRLTWANAERIMRGMGKTAFLTREEAEKALEKVRGGADY